MTEFAINDQIASKLAGKHWGGMHALDNSEVSYLVEYIEFLELQLLKKPEGNKFPPFTVSK